MGTVVVVGHGASAEGRGLGSRIDEHPVVRMWNCHWQAKADYGVRYDYGLFCPPLDGHRKTPSQSWWAYDVNSEGAREEIDGVPVRLLMHRPWEARALSMGATAEGRRYKLTRGCAAICAAMGLLKPDCLLLVGFDMIRAGATVSPRYGSAAQADFDEAMAGREHVFKTGGEPREGAHDLNVESRLVTAMAAEGGIEPVWLP